MDQERNLEKTPGAGFSFKQYIYIYIIYIVCPHFHSQQKSVL